MAGPAAYLQCQWGYGQKLGMLYRISVLLLLLCVVFSSARTRPGGKGPRSQGGNSKNQPKCGYQSCHPTKKGMLNVHLVPHSHDDVGWLKNVNQYYYGTMSYIQQAAVHSILETASQSLMADPDRRFIFVEMAFMDQWWNDKTEYKKRHVRELINQGRLEIALGAWSMADEAVIHYTGLIEQHSRGFKYLKDNFGSCAIPRIGWQIDPFGHSKEVAALFAQFGYDGMFFGRLDYQDKDKRMANKTMEMLWRASQSLGHKANLFTGALFNNYNYPEGLCWDEYCRSDPIVEKKELPEYNGDNYINIFKRAAENQKRSYGTNHIMFTMGADFHYSNAEKWFTNLDKLIKLVNDKQKENGTVNVLYSTPACYLYSLNQQNKTWPEKTDDFFPYAHKPHAFWTGYYTSRPSFKRYVRESNNLLHACKQVNALARLHDTKSVDDLWKEFSIVQHHDAITGTAKQRVDNDYRKRLAFGTNSCQNVMKDAYKKWLPARNNKLSLRQEFCNQMNISMCNVTETSTEFLVTIYNPRAHNRSHWVRIPIRPTNAYKVLDSDGKKIPVQIIELSVETTRIPERHQSIATHELIFRVRLPALGYSTYFVRQSSKSLDDQLSVKQKIGPSNNILENEYIKLEMDEKTGYPTRLTNKLKNLSIPFEQKLLFYRSSMQYIQPSGAYIFRPEKQHAARFHFNPDSVYIVRGLLVSEVHLNYDSWANQVIRIYQGAMTVEMEWTVGPLPLDNFQGTEVITEYITSIRNGGAIYTDANSRQMMYRKRDHRETWNFVNSEPVAGNYYPITSRAYIQDPNQDVQFTVLTDRAQGGGSIKNGTIEIMLHRRGTKDDMLGVGEPLDERGSDSHGLVCRGKHWILLDTKESSTHYHRQKALDIYKEPILSFIKMKRRMRSKINLEYSALLRPLPSEIHLLSLEEWDDGVFLIRLEHIYEITEVDNEVVVDLQNLFKNITIVGIREMTLGANMKLSDLQRLKWRSVNVEKVEYEYADRSPVTGTEVVLKPMEIRTFEIKVE